MNPPNPTPTADRIPGEATWDSLPADLQAALEGRWRAAARAHGRLALTLRAFVDDLLMLWRRGKERQGLAADHEALRGDLDRLHYDDLFLARLCERGDEAAWTAFAQRYAPDLRQVLQRHAGPGEAEHVTSAVLADVALPPARKSDRTLLGTYEGTGPLWAWLATIGIRRLRKQWGKREVPLEAAGGAPAAQNAPVTELDDEARRFQVALRDAWRTLEPREALALTWKHHDGLPQRDVARLLNTSEPTVSRIVTRAIAKVRGSLRAALPDPGGSEGLWTRLEAALSHHFEMHRAGAHREVDDT